MYYCSYQSTERNTYMQLYLIIQHVHLHLLHIINHHQSINFCTFVFFSQKRNQGTPACFCGCFLVGHHFPSRLWRKAWQRRCFLPACHGKPLGQYIEITPPKINMEPKNGGLEDVFPFPRRHLQVPCWFCGYMLSICLKPWFSQIEMLLEEIFCTSWYILSFVHVYYMATVLQDVFHSTITQSGRVDRMCMRGDQILHEYYR